MTQPPICAGRHLRLAKYTNPHPGSDRDRGTDRRCRHKRRSLAFTIEHTNAQVEGGDRNWRHRRGRAALVLPTGYAQLGRWRIRSLAAMSHNTGEWICAVGRDRSPPTVQTGTFVNR